MYLTRGNMWTARFTSNNTTKTSPTNNLGMRQTFDGQRGGKFKKGEFRINPVSITKEQGTCSSVDTSLPLNWYGQLDLSFKVKGEVAAAFDDGTLPSVPVLSSDVSINKTLAKLNKPDLDVGLMLGELSETIHMLRNPLESLRMLVSQMRSQARGLAGRKKIPLSKALTGTWLEYVYGVLPLCKDIQDIRDHFESKCFVERAILRRQASSTIRGIGTPAVSYEGAGWYSKFTLTKSSYASRRVTTHVYYRYNEWAREYEALTRFGVNPFQLVDVLYAITPYSFVVNWFLDIGTWLKAIQPHPQLDILGGCTTVKETQSRMIETHMGRRTDMSESITPWAPVVSRFDYRKESLTRRLETTWLAPPTVGNGIDTLSKAVNSAAMLWQRVPLKW